MYIWTLIPTPRMKSFQIVLRYDQTRPQCFEFSLSPKRDSFVFSAPETPWTRLPLTPLAEIIGYSETLKTY
jgi:hypothetical protein